MREAAFRNNKDQHGKQTCLYCCPLIVANEQ